MTHSHEAFASSIESQVLSAPLQCGFRGGGSLVGRIVDAVRTLIAASGGILTDDLRAMIKSAALSVFDKINLDQVPDVIELPLKALLRPILEHLLDAVFASQPTVTVSQ